MADKDSKGFRLVPADIPRRQRTSFYTEIISDFKKLGQKSVLVEGTGKKPVTLVQGLRKALEAEGMTDVGVVQRGEEVYLVSE
jgi:hypothetical protein